MNVWKISLQNMRAKPLYTLLSVLLLALSIALLLGIQQLKSSFEFQMANNLGRIDMVVGAKGSPLQLVLSSVLHIDNPTGNIPYSEYEKLQKNRMIASVVPISYGDNYKGNRIVGTTEDFFKIYQASLQEGKWANKSMEVVLGHAVAQKLKLGIGDTFLSSHGLLENQVDVHTDKLRVVGILQPTQKVIDRLIITHVKTIWDVHDHGQTQDTDHKEEEDHEHKDDEDHKHEDDREVTSLLVSFRNPMAMLTMPRNINQNTNMQAALPKVELDRLYEFTGVGLTTLSWIAYLILIISGMTIFISLYKMVKDRSFDLALLRTYGASNRQLNKMIVYEGLTVVLIAFVSGFLLTKALVFFIFGVLDNNSQNMIIPLPLNDLFQTLGLVVGIVLLSSVLAIAPIVRMNISSILSNEK